MAQFFRMSAALAAMALVSTPALARRTVVDGDGSVALSGYCDLNGQDCAAIPLGFTIDFGGTSYDSFVLYGNGVITFGNSAVSPATILGATTLASYGVPVISAGIDNTQDTYFGGGFLQSGELYGLTPDNKFGGAFSIYLGSSSSKLESTLDIEVSATGLLVKIQNNANGDKGSPFGVGPSAPFTDVVPQLAGYSIAGVGIKEYLVDQSTGPLQFFIAAPVTFGSTPTPSVPEPSTWAMMVAGFLTVGYAVRRSRHVARFRRAA